MRRFSYATGAAAAMLAAGPIFMGLLLIGATLLDRFPTSSGWQQLPQAVGLTIIAMPFGMAISAVPILVGGYAVGRLGRRWTRSRHPLIWGAIGALVACCMATALFGMIWESYVVFAATGALCAIIVRHGTRWFDEESA